MSVKIFPVQIIDDVCDSYKVIINGEDVICDTARVSAMPFNRRWLGHQRSIDQSELVNFISFATDGEAVI